MLAGTSDADDIVLRKQGVDDLDVDWILGTRAYDSISARTSSRSPTTGASSTTPS